MSTETQENEANGRDERRISDDLSLQLHNQYAENDNHKTNCIVSFIVAISFVFVGYGYAYIYPFKHSVSESYQYVLLGIYSLSILILSMLSTSCVNFGFTSRRDHHIIQNIRKRYYCESDCKEIFEDLYNSKSKCLLEYLPNHYFILFLYLNIFILVLSNLSITFPLGIFSGPPSCIDDCLNKSFVLYFGTLILLIDFFVYWHFYHKYQNFDRGRSC